MKSSRLAFLGALLTCVACARSQVDGPSGDASAGLADVRRVLSTDSVLLPSSTSFAVPIGLAQCITATANLANGDSIPVGRAEGLVVESMDTSVAIAIPTAVSPRECSGVLVAGVSQGRVSLVLRVEGSPSVSATRATLVVEARDQVQFSFGLGATASFGTSESCRGALVVMFSGDRRAYAIRDSLRAVSLDPTIATVEVSDRGALCVTGIRDGQTEIRVTHTFGDVVYEDSVAARIVEGLVLSRVITTDLPVFLAPGACVPVNGFIAYLETSSGSVGAFEQIAAEEMRVRCTSDGALTYARGMACAAEDAQIGARLNLRCCIGDVCTLNRAVVWTPSSSDQIALSPESHTRRMPRECVPVRTEVVSLSGARLDLTETGLVNVRFDPSTIPTQPTYDSGSFCFDVSQIAPTAQATAYFTVADTVRTNAADRRLRRSADLGGSIVIR